ncbi:hypothetical protein JMUB6875_29550 [Nocardia sp. JMUB6875]|uniref:serine/threonine-protein kinase n=1 Tax=Nocardia sp. JMUB6875 TaxID=3158170 RepID=UPI0032E7D84C
MTDHLAPGAVFAGYRIERVLGRGGMGAVYLAAHPRLPRYDALKVMASANPAGSGRTAAEAESTARFVREAELVARLEHPNIVPVHDRGTENGRPWIAMGFIDGIDASELIRRHPGGVPVEVAAHIAVGAARGLDEAHRIGVLHRDVKPANILLESRAGQPDRVYVTDFGIARPLVEADKLTESGTVVATLSYAAPEMLAGQTVDQRADVYALGCTLHELLTGAPPFVRSSHAELIRAHLSERPPLVSQCNPALPDAIGDVIQRALAKEPSERFDSCGALAQAAVDALTGANAPEHGRPRPRRWRVVISATALSAAVVVAAGIVALRAHQLSGAQDPAPVTPSTLPAAATTTASGGRIAWGAYDFMIQALPALLPPTPTSGGYRGLHCQAVDRESERIAITAPLGESARLRCNGNGAPLDWMFVSCNVHRNPMNIEMPNDSTTLGSKTWERRSGTGRMIWGIGTGQYQQPTGTLVIGFDDEARNFCELTVIGGTTAEELIEQWWNAAPL